MATCPNCNAPLLTFEYQQRSADEAQRSVTTCPSCPLDMAKLNMEPPKRPTPTWKRLSQDSGVSMPDDVRNVTFIRTVYILYVREGVLPSGDNTQTLTYGRVPVHGTGANEHARFLLPRVAEHYAHGPWSGMYVIRNSWNPPGGWGDGERVELYQSSTEMMPVPATHTWASISHTDTPDMYLLNSTQHAKARLMIISDDCDRHYWQQLVIAHEMGVLPGSIYSFMVRSDVSTISNLSPRAWDAPAPDNTDYVYSEKVDGERCWLFVMGKACYFMSRHKGHALIGWRLLNDDTGVSKPWVLDIEVLAQGPSALIDILMVDGVMAPATRTFDWQDQMWDMVQLHVPGIPVFQRHRHHTLSTAVARSLAVSYPCDGVVAVRDGDMETLKLKDVKSMELVKRGDVLESSDGVAVLSCPSSIAVEDSAIVEVRFTIPIGTRKVSIHSYLLRYDKDTANDIVACRNILSCAVNANEPSDVQRRVALLWCVELRSHILRAAWNTARTGKIVLDLGTGRGQSTDTLFAHGNGGYILLEPDVDSCERLRRRVGAQRIHTDPMTIISTIQGLHNGVTKCIIANMKAITLLTCEPLMKYLRPRLRCITCTFSAHFCVDALEFCAVQSLPFIGCCYLYDGVPPGSSLLDVCGVRMKVLNDSTASVQWGSDAVYMEPLVTRSTFDGIASVISGSSIHNLPEPRSNRNANMICSKVFVVRSS